MAPLLVPLFTGLGASAATAATLSTATIVAGATVGTMAATGAFKTPQVVSAHKLPDPMAMPEVKQEEAGDFAKRRAQRRRGRAKTVITGELEPQARGKTLLG